MFKQSFTFSDIGLVPLDLSEIASRDDVDPSTVFAGTNISLPIVLAPMDKVVGPSMEDAIERLHGLCVMPRNVDYAGDRAIPSISTKEYDKIETFFKTDPMLEHICVDVANGYSAAVQDTINKIHKNLPNLKIITGNVGSVEGYTFLAHLGVYAVRVGLGNGSVCSTSIQTGIGMGQASLIRDIANYRHERFAPAGQLFWPLIIADGGIKTSGDIVKSIALGADVVMAGKLFAGCEESPGSVVKFNDRLYKQYAGQASHAVKKSKKYIEGEDTIVPYCGKVEEIWSKLEDGIRSAMSYLNCKEIEDLKYLPDEYFCLLSQESKRERGIHA